MTAIRSAIQPAIRAAISGGYGSSSAWSPLTLFSASEVGVWYDPSDFSTMYQDSAGTTPVTAVGQPVGKILDKSGNGKHATQSTAASRPVLQIDGSGKYYLGFDGVDDTMSTATLAFSGADKMSVFAGAYKSSDANRTAICALGGSTQSFRLYGSTPAGSPNISWESGGSITTSLISGQAAPTTKVLVGMCDISGDMLRMRVNATETTLTSDRGTGGYTDAAITIGGRAAGDLPLAGRIYGLIIRAANSSAAEIAQAESYIAGKSGVTL